MLLKIKPLSVNDAWKGRRFKTENYKNYALIVCHELKQIDIPEGDLSIYLEFGFSSAGSDWDNPVKPFQDCLQKKYGFNDNRIKSAQVEVFKVNKGEEYIYFEIEQRKPTESRANKGA